jgi:hypothetical protein
MRIIPGSIALLVSSLCCPLAAQEGGDAVTLLRFDSGGPSDRLGEAVALAGDIDGDGTSDILVGAEFANSSGLLRNGSVFVYSGANGGLIYSFHGTADHEKFGSAVSSAGDINGDGFDDILVGSPAASPGAFTNSGQVDIFSGADGSSLLHLDGSADFAYFGRAVASCGDMDGDTVPDFIVGESGYNGNAGRVLVYSGATATVIHDVPGSATDGLGFSVSCAGDLDNDSVPDFLAGCPFTGSNGFTENGRVVAYSGATAAVLLQLDGDADGVQFGRAVDGGFDVDSDGRPDLIVGAPFTAPGGVIAAGSAFVHSGANGQLLHRVDGLNLGDNLGYSCALTGDVDGDGFSDFVVGARLFDAGGMQDAGRVLVLGGRDGSLLFHADGSAVQDNLGRSVAGGRDIDGDGLAEVIYGAPLADPLGNPLAGLAEVKRLVPILGSSATSVSSSAGGTVDFPMNFPLSEAGFGYLLLASYSGRGPTPAYGVSIPLTSDPLLTMMSSGAPPIFNNASGTLDASGDATAQLVLPPGTSPGMVGTTFYFAVVSHSGATSPRLVSNAIPLILEL